MRNLNRDFIKVAKALLVKADELEIPNDESNETFIDEVMEQLRAELTEIDANGLAINAYGSSLIRMVFKMQVHHEDGIRIPDYNYHTLRDYRNDVILWQQFKSELGVEVNNLNIEAYQDYNYIRIQANNGKQFREALSAIINLTFHSDYLAGALEAFNRSYGDYKRHYSSIEENARENRSKEGISKVIAEKAKTELEPAQWMAIEEEILKYQGQISNHIVSRTWGWEIEAPNPGKGIKTPLGVEAGSDGSVESYETDTDGCECDCRSCTYHSCDCQSCDDYNDDPDHCNDSDCNNIVSYEFRTTGGITRALHPGLRLLLDQIKESEKNETAGTHIHVFAKDLTARQIGTVLGAYAVTQSVWDVLCGRNVNEDDGRCKTYANHIPTEYIAATLRSDTLYHVGKFTAINTHHVANDRGTLEFRQMNCNFDFDRITFMGWMARGLIQAVKNGAAIHEFFKVKNITDIITIYAKYGYNFEVETNDIEDPFGSRYRQVTRAFQVA
jgi:hypothetical protein